MTHTIYPLSTNKYKQGIKMVWKDEDLSEVSQAIESQENVLFMDLQQEYSIESLRIFMPKIL